MHRSFDGHPSAVQCEQCLRIDHLGDSPWLRHDRKGCAGFLRRVQVAGCVIASANEAPRNDEFCLAQDAKEDE
jgi:hypothetical protein